MTDATIKDCAALGLYLDDELDVVASLAFEAHAATCDTCKRDLATGGALREQLQRDLVRYTADEAFRARISSTVGGAEGSADPVRTYSLVSPRTRRVTARRWLSLAAAGLLVAVLSSGTTVYLSRPGQEAQWVAGIAASHERAMLSGHVFDVASSNRHVVKPWFSGRTSIAPPVVDLGDAGFPLIGGRLDIPVREPMPVLVYRAGRHTVSVYMRPAQGDAAPRLEKIDGFSILRWKQQGFAFYAVSDADGAELGKFQKAFATKLVTMH
jgi:anti-sigma factor RsiW